MRWAARRNQGRPAYRASHALRNAGDARVPARAAALIALAFWIAEALAGAIALVAHYEWPS